MEITGVNTQYDCNSSVKRNGNNSDNPGVFETFKTERMKWVEKVKEEINEQLENDSERNIKMSDKQWQALMNHVDIAINNFKKNVREQEVESQQKNESISGNSQS
ncbi:hypothetical protein Ana3638_07395 [Anaerocolumna sedimenticola]|uniref:Uncharacterized protein n=1 Tax=Anaerocolumna sedimenticola TaxID=2696063 RepID=A0A6P1TL33_9FIRM|nr:hypothetical protein [Anaerocolumna sedimenticola]QHQ60616.1 hypothetical protein Ana3638_07395 [Anaerocolumna sedimenticola]